MKRSGYFFLAGFLLWLVPYSLQAQYPWPNITRLKRLDDGGVLVRWQIGGGALPANSIVKIVRTGRLVEDFQTIKRIGRPLSVFRFKDMPPAADLLHYRIEARVSRRFWVASTVKSISLNGVPYTPGRGEPPLAVGQSACPAAYRDQLRQLINAERTGAALSYNSKLEWAAQAHAIEAAGAQLATTLGFKDRIIQAGFFGHTYDGVIYQGGTLPADAVADWAQLGAGGCFSPLYSAHKYGGGGCVVDQYGASWFTLAFSE
jgi:hypothetical protein